MTVYVANILTKHHANGEMRPRLWADTSDEALCAAYACGAELSDRQPDTSWENYLISPDQLAEAVRQGARVCDWLEPAYQRAARIGDSGLRRQIERTRKHTARRRAELQTGDVVAYIGQDCKQHQAEFCAADGFQFFGMNGEVGLLSGIYRINGHAAS